MPEFIMSRTARRRAANALTTIVLSAVGVTMLIPLAWMVLTSLKTPDASALDLSRAVPQTSPRFVDSDVGDWPRFCRALTGVGGTEPHIAQGKIRELLPESVRAIVDDVAQTASPSLMDRAMIVSGLNQVILHERLWLDEDLAAHRPEASGVRAVSEDDPDHAQRLTLHRNRAILDALFSGHVTAAHRFHVENYRTVLTENKLIRALLNSFFITALITAGQVFTSSLAGFAFSRLRFAGRDRIFLLYLGTLMVPVAVTMIPTFILLRELGWIDTYAALTIPVMFSAYGTFMLRQFFMTLPTSLEEAAILDGCSAFGIYRHVVLPLSKPALTALAIITFMGSWRSFMWPLIVSHSEWMQPLPVALAGFRDLYGVQWPLMMAGSVIMIVPMLVVFLVGQRYFVSGITVGALKG